MVETINFSKAHKTTTPPELVSLVWFSSDTWEGKRLAKQCIVSWKIPIKKSENKFRFLVFSKYILLCLLV